MLCGRYRCFVACTDAVMQNEIRIVQASLLGSILANLLLILGMCFLLGGLRFREQVRVSMSPRATEETLTSPTDLQQHRHSDERLSSQSECHQPCPAGMFSRALLRTLNSS